MKKNYHLVVSYSKASAFILIGEQNKLFLIKHSDKMTTKFLRYDKWLKK